MFAMQPKELDNVFLERVLGVFVPNLVIILVNACPTRSCEDSPRLLAKCPMLFLDQSQRPFQLPFALVKLLPLFIVSLNLLAK